MSIKLEKMKSDILKARERELEYHNRVKELERKYNEAEKTEVHGMMQAANLTPDKLKKLIEHAAKDTPDAAFLDSLVNENSAETELKFPEPVDYEINENSREDESENE